MYMLSCPLNNLRNIQIFICESGPSASFSLSQIMSYAICLRCYKDVQVGLWAQGLDHNHHAAHCIRHVRVSVYGQRVLSSVTLQFLLN